MTTREATPDEEAALLAFMDSYEPVLGLCSCGRRVPAPGDSCIKCARKVGSARRKTSNVRQA